MEFTPLPSEMPESPGSDVSDEASESTPDISAGDSSTAEPERLNLNNEGAVDSLFTRLAADSSFVAVDTDNNSSVDAVQWDVDGDGTDDALVTKTDDGYVISDPSGMLAPHAVSRDQLMGLAPGIVAALDGGSTAESAPEETRGTSDPVSEDSGWRIEEGVLIGDPVGDSRYWFQQAQNGFCLPASIAQIVSEYTGVIYQDEIAFVDIANEIGAFVVGYDGVPGIPFEKGVEILNRAGVPAEHRFGDLESLAAGLAGGYNIIVAVDSGEIWTGEATEDKVPDHAVVVTGIDPERGTMLLSDPGSPDGNLSEIPIEVFMDSWADSQNAMIVCDEVPENTPASRGSDLTGEAVSDPLGRLSENLAAAARPTDGAEHQSWEETTSWAVRAPWMLLPVTLPATSVNAL